MRLHVAPVSTSSTCLPPRETHRLHLIVMLYGCGQSSTDFARGTGKNTLADKFGFLVLYPAQARDAHHCRCWNWYKRGDQKRGAEGTFGFSLPL